MMGTRFTAAVLACVTLTGMGCAGPEARATEPPTAAGAARDYVFVLIKTGPATGLTPEAQREAFAGHFSNMKRLAEAGELLIAGPFGEPRDPTHRGLFVIDETTVEAGMVHAATDPTTVAGIFTLEGHLFTTDAPLVDLLRLEKEDEARRLADPEVPDAWEGRRYVLATAAFVEDLYQQVQSAEGVLIAGRLHGAGEEGGDEVLVWLDAEGVEAAKAMLPEAGRWTLHGWYGSRMVAQIAE
jgi:uncharacterized protein YciI